jgi:hypothetical protein
LLSLLGQGSEIRIKEKKARDKHPGSATLVGRVVDPH